MASRKLSLTHYQWALGVFPSMPGFISNVNNRITVSLGWTHVYYISFLVGFSISAVCFIALHHFFPAPMVKDFVLSPQSRRENMAYYQEKWDLTEQTGTSVPVNGESVLPNKDASLRDGELEGFPKDV
jgi:hypothetical protein